MDRNDSPNGVVAALLWVALAPAAFLSGCIPPAYVPAGPDTVQPPAPIDFDRAHLLARMAVDVTQNSRLTSENLRSIYNQPGQTAFVFATTFPGDNGESRFMLITRPDERRQILVFGGTNTLLQWAVDAQTDLIYQPDIDAGVHLGWNVSALQILNVVLPQLRADYELTITGFSLGGAVAPIAARYLMLAGYDVTEVVTFGAPRLTDRRGVESFASVPLLRFVNHGDPFPHMVVPPFEAEHFGPMVILFDNSNYAYVPAGDPLLQAEARRPEDFLPLEFQLHNEEVYLGRVASLSLGGTLVEYRP
jgi:triacylglycerol lipase